MSTVEAAASLFGPSDSGSDFFTAPEGPDSRTESPSNGTNGNDTLVDQDSSSLFGGTADAGDATLLFSGHEAQAELYAGSVQTSAEYPSTSAQGYDDYKSSYAGSGIDNDISPKAQYGGEQTWDAQDDQWNGYGQYAPAQNQGAAEIYPVAETNSYDFWSTSNGAYQPDYQGQPTVGTSGSVAASHLPEQSAYTGASAHTQQNMSSYQPAYSSQSQENAYSNVPNSNSYDPYRPALADTRQTTHSSVDRQHTPYSAQVQPVAYSSALGRAPYDPYSPVPAGARQSTQPSSYASAPASSTYDAYTSTPADGSSVPGLPMTSPNYSSATMFVPPPASHSQKLAAAPYRPASSNAYDPPIPVKKRSVSARFPNGPYQAPSSSLSSPPVPSRSLAPSSIPAEVSPHNESPRPPPPPRTSRTPAPKPSGKLNRAVSPNQPLLSNTYALPQAEHYDNSINNTPPNPVMTYSDIQPNDYPLPTSGGTSNDSVNYEQNSYPTAKTNALHDEPYGMQQKPTTDPDNEANFSEPRGSSPPSTTQFHESGSPSVPNIQRSGAHDPYKPSGVPVKRLASPEGFQSFSAVEGPTNSHAPVRMSYGPPQAQEHSLTTISSLLSSAGVVNDHYVPPSIYKAQVSPSSSIDSYSFAKAPAHDTIMPENQYVAGRESLDSYYSAPVSGPYAPSPSLLGTNDPLGRANGKAPVMSFGFGGKLVTCFHARPDLNTGFDVALSARKRTDVHIHTLQKAIPESVLNMPSPSYPGPLFGDPGSPVTAIMRTATSTNAKVKAKKDKVSTYLSERAEELEKGVSYHTQGSIDRRRADGKLALVRLIRVLVEHDGQLRGSPAIENAVRTALLPRMSQPEDVSLPDALHIAPVPATSQTDIGISPADQASRQSALQKMQELLLRGEKQKAYHMSLDEKLFAHAMVIASGIDKETFKEAVNEFVRSELGVQAGMHVNGLESLRLAYSLFSNQPAMTVQQLVPAKSLQATLSARALPNYTTPLTPNFPIPSAAVAVPNDILSNWQEYAVMLYSGQIGMGTESSAALTNLGDCLIHNDWVEAAHCCYLLSPQSSPIGGISAPNAKIVLVGSHNPQKDPIFFKDPETIVLSEIVEFALSLHTPAKGQEAFMGFAHLQAYRLIRALQLAELGYVGSAKRYCEAISSTSHRPSPYLNQLFTELLGELSRRLNGDPELDKANSWIGGKISKPSLDSIGDWLGGTLSKFVAGDGENSSPVAPEHAPNNPAYAGAFSQYSTISSTNPSRGNSPSPSFASQGYAQNGVPARSGSAMALHTSGTYPPLNRSSSAMAYSRPGSRKGTPPPKLNSADAATTSFMQSHTFSQAMANYGGNNRSGDFSNGIAYHPGEGTEETSQESGWWSAAYGDSSGPTPTATSFVKLDEHTVPYGASSSNGFISLMDEHNMTPSLSMSRPASYSNVIENDDAEDLGFGNSSRKKQALTETQGAPAKLETNGEEYKEVPKKPDAKPTTPSSSGSWLGRLFTRSASTTPGPVKANLGEENAFYYDKELKRWVNKKAGAESTQPVAPAAPPPRAQTVSPSRAVLPPGARNSPPPPSPMPPGRPQSAMDLSGPPKSTGPPKTAASRLRSNLGSEESVPPLPSASPTPAALAGLTAAPPTGRPKSAATRRNVRSRYIDVLQQ